MEEVEDYDYQDVENAILKILPSSLFFLLPSFSKENVKNRNFPLLRVSPHEPESKVNKK